MGCTQSKIENEEAVTRCKERKHHMKEAVSARNAFAAAHYAYAMSLKNTGAALSDYAVGEVNVSSSQSVGEPDPVHVAPPTSAASAESSSAIPQSFTDTMDPLPPPPPLPTSLSSIPPPPLHRAVTMPEMLAQRSSGGKGLIPTVLEEDSMPEDQDDIELENHDQLVRKSRSRGGSNRGRKIADEEKKPPRPQPSTDVRELPRQPTPQQDHFYDYFFSSTVPGTTLEDNPTPPAPPSPPVTPPPESVSDKAEPVEERNSVTENQEKDDFRTAVGGRGKGEMEAEKAAMLGGSGKGSKKGKGMVAERKASRGSMNLCHVFTELDDNFLKASESAHDVSKMLEATRLHYHSNFADNRGHINHSERVLRVITWNRSFRGMPNGDDGKDDFDSEENETHATVLDKLLAWEKKLYDEVKAGEIMKLEYHRKVANLKKLQNRGANTDAVERAKASVSHLHTRYIVDMQSMDSTVSEINRLRDEQLYPKLVQLVNGMAKMWEYMHSFHNGQAEISKALRSLAVSEPVKETSEHHHERTIQLLAVVKEWQVQFCKLMDYQKEYIKALKQWLRLNLVPIESTLKEKVSSPPRVQSPLIEKLLLAWHDRLDKLPDEIARTAINNFVAVVSTLMQQQEDEMKLKQKCEHTRKELSRKTREFEDWYRKYMQKRIPEELDPDSHESSAYKDTVAFKEFQLEELKRRLEDEEEDYEKQRRHVREKSLTSLKTRLPELFRAMSDVAAACTDMYLALSAINTRPSRSRGPSQSQSQSEVS